MAFGPAPTHGKAELLAVAPHLAADGTLTFTLVANANGSATITVLLRDDGGTANGGSESSATRTFTIVVVPVNDPLRSFD